MRKINSFEKKGGRLVSIVDSISGESCKCTWRGETKSFWVRAMYIEVDGRRCPAITKAEEVWLIEDGDEKPAPSDGWCYAAGFFG